MSPELEKLIAALDRQTEVIRQQADAIAQLVETTQALIQIACSDGGFDDESSHGFNLDGTPIKADD